MSGTHGASARRERAWNGAAGAERPVAEATGGRGAVERGAVEQALVTPDALWASASAVRQAVGALAYTLRPGERRPAEAEVRAAVAMACAVCELARDPAVARWRTRPAGAGGGAPDAAGTAPRSVEALAERAGLERPVAEAALALLERCGAVARGAGPGGEALLVLDARLLAPAPAAPRIDWPAVRDRVRSAGGSVGAALAVMRELAVAIGALAPEEAPPPLRLSVRTLEERTGYGRSTVAESLAALERAGLVDVEARAGRTARFVLRPAALGGADLPPAAGGTVMEAAGGGAGAGASVRAAPGARARAAAPGAPAADRGAAPGAAPGAAGAAVLLGEFAGTPIHAPPGTPLVVSCDAAGRWSCRVGPFLVLGPVRDPGG